MASQTPTMPKMTQEKTFSVKSTDSGLYHFSKKEMGGFLFHDFMPSALLLSRLHFGMS